MATALPHAVAAIALTVVLAMGLGPGATTAGTDQSTTSGLSSEQAALAEWALGLFDEAGLALPPVQFVAHSTGEGCLGRAGAHVHRDGRSIISICTADTGPTEEFLYLHELAHAWDRQALSDERRRDFLEARGLDHWRSEDAEWHERGAEQAAEIVVWGLMDRPIRSIRIGDHSCAQLRAGYLLLTGEEPLHGYTDYCA